MSMTQGDKLVIVKTTGILRELGNICGPILHPSRLKIAKIADMVNNGKLVFEVNPEDRSQQVQLTRLNVTSENFKKLPSTEAPKEEEVVVPDTKGAFAEVSGVGSIPREVIDPSYTPEVNTIATMVSDETSVDEIADEVTEDESAESDSVAEEETEEVSSDVDASQQNDMQAYVHMSRKERKKNKNRNGSDFSAR